MADCIIFPGTKDEHGYGRIEVNGKRIKAHRLAFFKLHGWWPPVVRHTCDNPSCWNQAHLVAGTQADNMRDMRLRGRARAPKGESHHKAKLTDASVREIRRLRSEGLAHPAELAVRYGVARTTIDNIVAGRTWKHVT